MKLLKWVMYWLKLIVSIEFNELSANAPYQVIVTRETPKQKPKIYLGMEMTLVKALLPAEEQRRKEQTFLNLWVGK